MWDRAGQTYYQQQVLTLLVLLEIQEQFDLQVFFSDTTHVITVTESPFPKSNDCLDFSCGPDTVNFSISSPGNSLWFHFINIFAMGNHFSICYIYNKLKVR
ncbi:MAG: hypothetical protein IPI23_21960 [Bacteroidetes bacterium]|nr:hypothetical protein [Bacteroidota bacterium]